MSPSPVPISKTKIIVPHRRPELLSRNRLLESLNAFLDRKLILLSAPAGFGKTSLLVDLAHQTNLPVCWLSLDPLDRDPQRFIAYIIAALAERFKGINAPLLPQLNTLKSIETDAEPLLIALTNELYEQVEEDFLLILDDYHLLDDVPIITSLLNRFLQLVDDNCHIILSSRSLPSLPDITLMVAREQINGLSQTDLAFQPVEIQALYHQNHQQDLSEQAARQLAEQSGGWITGLLLSDLSGGSNVSRVDAFSYLGRQVLDQQPGPIREFLLRTSLPEEFNAELCEAILEPTPIASHSWPTIMGHVLEKNLFVLPVGDGRWLRYHPLFREFLQARLREEHPSEIIPIFERLTRFHEKSNEWEKAYFACQQLNDPEKLADVVERGGTPMLQHALTTLENWVNSLPPNLLRSRPGLISLRGSIALSKGDLRDATELIQEAVTIYRGDVHLEGLTLALVRRAVMYRMSGNYTASLKDAEEALQLTEPHPHLQPIFAEALRLKGGNLYRLGNMREAVKYIERSLALYTALNETGSIPWLLMEAGLVYGCLGDIEAAKNSFQKALGIWQAEKNFAAQTNVLNNLAVLHHQNGEYELAADTYEIGLSLTSRSRNTRSEAMILIGLGDLYAEVGEFESAEQAYEKALPLAKQWEGSFIDIYLIFARTSLALLRGDPVHARTVFQDARKKMRAISSLYDQGLYSMIEGRLHLLNAQYSKAVLAFRNSRELFLQNGRAIESTLGGIWLAAALGTDGQTEEARVEIRELLNTNVRPSHAVLVGIQQAAPWLRSMLKDPQVGRSLNGLLDKAARIEAKWPGVRRSLRRLAQSIHMPAPSLVVRAFGRAEVQLDGHTVTMPEWSTVSVRDLFFYLIYKSGPVTKEQIAAALWPEVDEPQTLKQRFKAYIFRLRRATRRDAILFDEEYYRFNFSLDYEYDVEAFETYLARSRMVRTNEERIEQLQKAIDLVRGPYLSEVDMPWAIGERDRLEQSYVSGLENLASLYLESGQFQQAVDTAQRALKTDPYLEIIHQLLMRTYAALGDRTSIQRQYQACKTSLAELGFAPALETRELYKRLMG
jgi:ATP/maltotriose-dependent transcriptional regulator MalT/two-component SAPR family response regulator